MIWIITIIVFLLMCLGMARSLDNREIRRANRERRRAIAKENALRARLLANEMRRTEIMAAMAEFAMTGEAHPIKPVMDLDATAADTPRKRPSTRAALRQFYFPKD